ncbi:MAG TPA: phenylalanine--tRNA ligase subunit alpha [Gemmatimonadaceae bacterium]|nr:phenylalanine--tRNA ligase subunit alpha [Gemmatimonadaceae bacterium]
MTLEEFRRRAAELESEGVAAIAAAGDASALAAARTALLGRKSGSLTALLRSLASLPADALREAGAAVNQTKGILQAALDLRASALAASAPAAAAEDLTMPARRTWRGSKHPVTLVLEEVIAIFRELGFTVATGPEAETEWYNFSALNFPPDHPAMDMQDTLYLEGRALLRTHTSPVQVRTLQAYPPPIRILAPGNVYRRDFFDASHAPMFAQVEGMAVDEGITFADLKATLTHFANRFFGATKTRFRPSYFPFTEPSAEMDVQCGVCHGSGCSACKGTGWIEILGSGLMHPNVLRAAGLDAAKVSGWAFGMGPGRVALARYGIPDIRLLYDSDVAFLEQFSE